jgi:deoxyribodipyrimidine photolyase-related protein
LLLLIFIEINPPATAGGTDPLICLRRSIMVKTSIIFPHQLFAANPALEGVETVFLVEEPLLFTQFRFHRQKLVLHRAAMKFYANYLRERGFRVNYIEFNELSDTASIADVLSKNKVSAVSFCDPTDDWLENRFAAACDAAGIKTVKHDTPYFLNTAADLEKYFAGRMRFLMAAFYERERRRLGVLLDDEGQPLGGRWSFDAENRKRLPKNIQLPAVSKPPANEFVSEAISYVNQHFPDNYGYAEDFAYPTTFAEAESWLDEFLRERFVNFGEYEDAMAKDESFLFHSVLTPALNCGLLTPRQILDKTLSYAENHQIPLNSLEGFVRQIIGWREFMRGCYAEVGRKQRTRNFWRHTRKLPESFWTGETGIAPLDTVIKKVLRTAYCHHIERLMILGNFMVLAEIDPDDAYRWFMELFIDAYDWVMVSNVYGMSLHADGGLLATKPYISGSNYILKMSDFEKGEWCEIWDGLYWRFIAKHRDFFEKNPRLSLAAKNLEKMDAARREKLLNTAERFLQNFSK